MIKINTVMCLLIGMVTFQSCNTAKNDGLLTTKGGYKYEFISKGSGEQGSLGKYAYFNAEVSSIEGDVIYSSKETGAPGILQIVESSEEKPSPFSDVLLHANVGDSLHIYLGKGQGVEGSGYDSLVYKIGLYELLTEEGHREKVEQDRLKRLEKEAEFKALESGIADKVASWFESYKKGAYNNDILKTETGLEYYFVEKGDGPLTKVGEMAEVHYFGVLKEDGTMFDNSWRRGNNFSFPLGQGRVIKGWDEGVALLPKGSKAFLIIPSDLAYGSSGSGAVIKPDADLIFYIET